MIYLGLGFCNSFGASRGLFFQRRWSILGIGILYRKNHTCTCMYMYMYVYVYVHIISFNPSLKRMRPSTVLGENDLYWMGTMNKNTCLLGMTSGEKRYVVTVYIFLLRRWPLLSFVGVPQFFWGRDVDPNYKGFPAKMVANSILNASKWCWKCWKWLSKNNFPKPLPVKYVDFGPLNPNLLDVCRWGKTLLNQQKFSHPCLLLKLKPTGNHIFQKADSKFFKRKWGWFFLPRHMSRDQNPVFFAIYI